MNTKQKTVFSRFSQNRLLFDLDSRQQYDGFPQFNYTCFFIHLFKIYERMHSNFIYYAYIIASFL